MLTNEILRKMLDVLTDEEKKMLFDDLIKEKVNDFELSSKIKEALLELGIPYNLTGYIYLQEAIAIVVKDETSIRGNIVKKLYPQIAEKYETTPAGVERAIRHAIFIASECARAEAIKKYLGNTVSSKRGWATNSVFIFQIANAIK